MVIVHNDQPPPSPSSDQSNLRTDSGWNFTISDIALKFEDFKMNLCQSTMSSCARTMKEDRVCSIEHQCNDFYREIIIPITHGFCKHASDHCQVNDLEETLKKLYDAGAISESPITAKKIDDQIQELNELQHKIRTIQSAINFEQAKKARDDYLAQRQKNHDSQSKDNKKITEKSEAVV